jgi:hypothetical protein
MIKYVLGFAIAAFLIVACGERKPNIVKQLDREGKPTIVTVHFYENERELKQAMQRYNPPEGLQGMAIWSESDAVCTIHTLAVKRVDDEATRTLGHEMLHCIYGSFHK